jgi:small conductance mechanosensitive channel
VFIIGRIIIGKLVSLVKRGRALNKMDPTVRSFLTNFVNVGLYVVLVISIISVLGVPMASVITVLASAGVAVGLALQGALSNLAGGIMLLIFRPFNVGDYVKAAGEEGVVKEIALLYTVLTTVDNKRVIVPNGSLMNANVTNFSAEPTRRVDLTFSCAKSENIQKVQDIMVGVMNANDKVMKTPAPFAQISGGTNEAMEFTVRAWCATEQYWDVYFELIQQTAEALGAAGVQAPAVRVITETKTK